MGVAGGDGEPGGLFEPVRGQEHPVREGAELVDGTGAQSRLSQGRGHELCLEAGLPKPQLERERLVFVVGRQRLEQPPPLTAGEAGHHRGIHGPHPPSSCRWREHREGQVEGRMPARVGRRRRAGIGTRLDRVLTANLDSSLLALSPR